MKLLYTGAGKLGEIQKTPEYSLGSYISQTEIPEGLLSALFDTISRFTVKQNKIETRVIAVQNDEGVAISNFRAWFHYSDESDSLEDDNVTSTFKIGWKAVSTDDCGEFYTDNIGSIYASPRGTTMWEADGEANALNLPDLEDDQYLIIFIQRILDSSLQLPMSDEDLVAILNDELILDKEEEVKLFFSWD